jgi:hypothetical protein
VEAEPANTWERGSTNADELAIRYKHESFMPKEKSLHFADVCVLKKNAKQMSYLALLRSSGADRAIAVHHPSGSVLHGGHRAMVPHGAGMGRGMHQLHSIHTACRGANCMKRCASQRLKLTHSLFSVCISFELKLLCVCVCGGQEEGGGPRKLPANILMGLFGCAKLTKGMRSVRVWVQVLLVQSFTRAAEVAPPALAAAAVAGAVAAASVLADWSLRSADANTYVDWQHWQMAPVLGSQ